MQKFWMVYAEGNRSPAHKHYRREDATTEAERLAMLPGIGSVYLLGTEAVATVSSVCWEKCEDFDQDD